MEDQRLKKARISTYGLLCMSLAVSTLRKESGSPHWLEPSPKLQMNLMSAYSSLSTSPDGSLFNCLLCILYHVLGSRTEKDLR